MLTDDQAKANVSANVQKLLSEKGWNQADLARATDESEARVSLAVRGVKLASAAFLARIAEALDTTVDDLLSGPQRKSRQTA